MDDFKVSVVIPVYNTKQYLSECIESVVHLDEVNEVLIIDDGSSDGSLQLAQQLARKYPKIKVSQHPNGMNRGRSASKNLGIQKAQQAYISFLDSDDVYLKSRYEITQKIFSDNPNVDGVYEAIGILFESDEQKRRWDERFNFQLTTVKEDLNGPKLFRSILWDTKGHFSGNGLTIKKSAFNKCGLYPNFTIAEDTHLFLRMALTCNLKAGNIKSATGNRRIHGTNSVLDNKKKISEQHIQIYKDLIKWCSAHKMKTSVKLEVFFRLMLQHFKHMKIR